MDEVVRDVHTCERPGDGLGVGRIGESPRDAVAVRASMPRDADDFVVVREQPYERRTDRARGSEDGDLQAHDFTLRRGLVSRHA